MSNDRRFEPTPLRDSLDEVVRGLRGPTPGGAGGARAMGTLFSRWTDAVGQLVADHARPITLDGERLLVEVDDPAWATQLRLLEADIVERLRSVAGLQVSRFDVRVKRR